MDEPNATFAVDAERLSSLGVGEEDALTPLDGVDNAEVLARAAELNAAYRDAPPADVLRAALDAFPGRIALVSSFGAESAVLLHMAARVDPSVTVLFIDTGLLFGQTLDYRRQLSEQLGLADVRVLTPSKEDNATLDPKNVLWKTDTDACCGFRKVAPLDRVVAGYDAWITGRKRFHGGDRLRLPVFEAVDGQVKVNPLANMSKAALDAYAVEHALPPHPLVAQGYPSLGCWPCTSPVADGADVRAGRWAGSEKTECGIHVARAKPARPRAF